MFKKKVSPIEFGSWLGEHYAGCAETTMRRLMARYIEIPNDLPKLSENHEGFPKEPCYNFVLGLATACGLTSLQSIKEKQSGVIEMEFLSRIDRYNPQLGSSFNPVDASFHLNNIIKNNAWFINTGDLYKGDASDSESLTFQLFEYCMNTYMEGTKLFLEAPQFGPQFAKIFAVEFSTSFNEGAIVYKKVKIK